MQAVVTSSTRTSSTFRAVLLGQHPSKVAEVVRLFAHSEIIELVAAVSDLLDAGVVLQAMVHPVDIFICGAYFDLPSVLEVVEQVGGKLKLIKVPDGLMMEGGGPPSVVAYIEEQARRIRRDMEIEDD